MSALFCSYCFTGHYTRVWLVTALGTIQSGWFEVLCSFQKKHDDGERKKKKKEKKKKKVINKSYYQGIAMTLNLWVFTHNWQTLLMQKLKNIPGSQIKIMFKYSLVNTFMNTWLALAKKKWQESFNFESLAFNTQYFVYIAFVSDVEVCQQYHIVHDRGCVCIEQ